MTELPFDRRKQYFTSFGVQHIGFESERILAKFFGSGIEGLLIPSGDCYSRAFSNE